jgi:hypothetical protein
MWLAWAFGIAVLSAGACVLRLYRAERRRAERAERWAEWHMKAADRVLGSAQSRPTPPPLRAGTSSRRRRDEANYAAPADPGLNAIYGSSVQPVSDSPAAAPATPSYDGFGGASGGGGGDASWGSGSSYDSGSSGGSDGGGGGGGD